METQSSNYVCIHCGVPVDELYHSYSPTVLKMARCKKCDQTIDEYIEYDIVLIFLDLFLQRLRAYRHVLFNMNIQVLKKTWRLAIIFILCDSYYKWVKSKSSADKTVDIYDLEWHFYISVLQSCSECGLLLLLCTLMTKLLNKTQLTFVQLMSLFSISFYGNILTLLAVVWEQHNNLSFQCLTQVFLFVTHVQILRALTNGSVPFIMATVFGSMALAKIITLILIPF